jgi:hypothetical protein
MSGRGGRTAGLLPLQVTQEVLEVVRGFPAVIKEALTVAIADVEERHRVRALGRAIAFRRASSCLARVPVCLYCAERVAGLESDVRALRAATDQLIEQLREQAPRCSPAHLPRTRSPRLKHLWRRKPG